MQNTPRDNLSNSTVDSQFWVLMLFVAVCQFFLLMLSFMWGKCWIYLLKCGACLHAAATSQILDAKKKRKPWIVFHLSNNCWVVVVV
jgi:hypothetical protein